MKTNTLYIFIVSLITLILLGFLGWYASEEIKQKIDVVRAYNLKEIQGKNLEVGNKLKKDIETLSDQEKILTGALIDSKNIIDFISQIEIIGKNIGIEVLIEKVTRGAKEKIGTSYGVESIELNIQTEGTLSQVQFLIEKIMNLNKSLTIKELKIYKTSREGQIKYTAKFILEGLTISYEKI